MPLATLPRGLLSWARSVMGGDPAHGWPHVARVARLAEEIVAGAGLNVDWRVLDAAIALHDVGRFTSGGGHHALESAEAARRLLPRYGYSPGEVEAVVHAILAHSYSLGVRAETAEAMVLSDADKLDALGAVGIARVFHTGCQLGRSFTESLAHFREKILLLPGRLYLDYSRGVAASRMAIIEEFLSAASKEYWG